jgi:RNA polymerase sigma-70 factor (ECF subfamily)
LEDFASTIEQHQEMVFRTLARLTGEREGLEDLAQEVFLRLHRALPHFRNRAKVSTFLYRIIVNVVNDEWRKRRTSRRMVAIDEDTQVLVHPGAGPEELLEKRDFQAALAEAMRQLPLRDRAILTLHYQEGRKYEEIAAILDVPLGTVKTHLFRARERLKGMMGEWISQCRTTR